MNDWYYAIGQDRHGPVTESEIRALIAAGTLRADSLVWRAGMAEWARVDSIDVFTSDVRAWSEGASQPGAGSEQAPTGESQLPTSASEGSTFNPYAPPGTEAPLAPPPDEALEIVDPRPRLDIEYCVTRAWCLTLRNFGLIIGVGLLYWLITIGFMLFCDAILGVSDFSGDSRRGPGWEFRTAVSQLLQWFLGVYLGLGLIRVGLNITSGQRASVGDLFSEGALFWRGVGVSILYSLIVVIGLIALIIPGFYFMVRFAFSSVALVDKNCGVFEAFEYSSRLTKGNKWRLVLLWLVCLLITIAGALALLIGLLWALPTAWLAFWFVAYRYLHRGSKDTE